MLDSLSEFDLFLFIDSVKYPTGTEMAACLSSTLVASSIGGKYFIICLSAVKSSVFRNYLSSFMILTLFILFAFSVC